MPIKELTNLSYICDKIQKKRIGGDLLQFTASSALEKASKQHSLICFSKEKCSYRMTVQGGALEVLKLFLSLQIHNQNCSRSNRCNLRIFPAV
jgi:hypothetical protein